MNAASHDGEIRDRRHVMAARVYYADTDLLGWWLPLAGGIVRDVARRAALRVLGEDAANACRLLWVDLALAGLLDRRAIRSAIIDDAPVPIGRSARE